MHLHNCATGNIEPQHSCLRIEKFHTSVYDAVAQTNVNGWEEHRRGDLPEPVEPEFVSIQSQSEFLICVLEKGFSVHRL
eukprot:scaffold120062_cov21-Tisochrysis_lutea.AAC.1